MRKYLYVTFVLLLTLVLVSCDKSEPVESSPVDTVIEPVDLTVNVVETETINQNIYVHVVTNYTIDSLDLYTNLMNEIANNVYLDHYETIDGNLYHLTIYAYESQADYDASNDYFNVVYLINGSIDAPGLQLISILFTQE